MAGPADELLARAKTGDGEARMELAKLAARSGKRAEADHWITEAAAVGQRTAQLQTGVWRLAGYRGPKDVEGGIGIVRASAAAGEPSAMGLLGSLYASDVLGARNWAAAKSWLLKAAEAHEPRALLQVALMLPAEKKWRATRFSLLERGAGKSYPASLYFAGRTLLDEGGQDSQALARLTLAARGNDPNALRLLRGRRAPSAEPGSPVFELAPVNWTKIAEALEWPHERDLPQPVVRHAAPRVTTFNRLFTVDECEYVIARGAPFLKRRDLPSAVPGTRTSTTAKFGLTETDVLIQSLDALAARALGRDPAGNEIFSMIHYAPGQSYLPDGRAVAEAPPGDAVLGNLAQTMIVYLNEGYEGGESAFPRLGWRFKGRRGDALSWELRDADGRIDRRAVPEGIAPKTGEKFVLTKLVTAA